jgi:Sulfotransferase family
VETVVGHHRFHRLGVSEAAARRIAAEARTYREFVSELYSELARLCGKPFGGDKTPTYVRHLPLLHRLFPWTRSVHIIRDGRDVALSTLEWASKGKGPGRLNLWQENRVAVCALWWRWLVGTARRDGTNLSPDHHRELRYESLVADPEMELRGLARFLDLPFAPEMLTYHVGRMQNEPSPSAKGAWLPPTPGLRDWRTQMAPRDAELFEAIAGDVLSELGYERAFPTISSKVAAIADEWENRWTMEAREQRGP